MGDACCNESAESASFLAARHRGVLWAVLAINLWLFAVEVIAGLRAGSSALLGDSLDMLGDAFIYAASRPRQRDGEPLARRAGRKCAHQFHQRSACAGRPLEESIAEGSRTASASGYFPTASFARSS